MFRAQFPAIPTSWSEMSADRSMSSWVRRKPFRGDFDILDNLPPTHGGLPGGPGFGSMDAAWEHAAR
eukprot:2359854-Alexandrium_andersonii.AAC.1